MNWSLPLTVILVVLVLVVVIGAALKARSRRLEEYPYTKTEVLFSPAERSFLGVLEQAVGEEYRVFGKVRVADVIEPQRGLDRSNRQKALNRTLAKHFDFVLCEQSDLAVLCAIELDDRSHQAERRQARDAFLAGLCEAVALPLVRMPVQRTYSVTEVKAKVMSALSAAVEAPDVPSEAQQTALVGKLQAPSCPRCSAPMVRRQAKTGANAGEAFWGCSRFPKCRGIVPTNA